MSRQTTMHLLLLAVLGGTSCDGTAPRPGGSPGGLALVTTTGGIQPDSNGYTIMLDGTAQGSIGPNDSLTLPDVGAGSHAVELSDIQFNCATLGQFTRTVSVSNDAEAVVNYSVACDARSTSFPTTAARSSCFASWMGCPPARSARYSAAARVPSGSSSIGPSASSPGC